MDWPAVMWLVQHHCASRLRLPRGICMSMQRAARKLLCISNISKECSAVCRHSAWWQIQHSEVFYVFSKLLLYLCCRILRGLQRSWQMRHMLVEAMITSVVLSSSSTSELSAAARIQLEVKVLLYTVKVAAHELLVQESSCFAMQLSMYFNIVCGNKAVCIQGSTAVWTELYHEDMQLVAVLQGASSVCDWQHSLQSWQFSALPKMTTGVVVLIELLVLCWLFRAVSNSNVLLWANVIYLLSALWNGRRSLRYRLPICEYVSCTESTSVIRHAACAQT